jgi:hypothetical protein
MPETDASAFINTYPFEDKDIAHAGNNNMEK